MIRMILLQVVLSVIFGAAIYAWRTLTGKEKWQLTKYIGFAILSSAIALFFLVAIVLFF